MQWEDEWLSAAEAARRLGVDRSTITRWVQRGLLVPDQTPTEPGKAGYRFGALEVERARAAAADRTGEP
jgi:predicted site-specific integrase-resolvase